MIRFWRRRRVSAELERLEALRREINGFAASWEHSAKVRASLGIRRGPGLADIAYDRGQADAFRAASGVILELERELGPR